MRGWLDELPRPIIIPAAWWRWDVRRRRRKAQGRMSAVAVDAIAARRLFVDISTLARTDAGTGIQRLVKVELGRLVDDPPDGLQTQPVAATRTRPYRMIGWPLEEAGSDVVPLSPVAGDHFLGLDLSAHIIPRKLDEMMAWRRTGVRFTFVIYDMLPLLHPQWFSGKLVAAFRRWIRAVAILADDVLCISPDVQRHFHDWMDGRYGLSRSDIPSQLMPISVDGWAGRLWSEAQVARAPALADTGPYCLAVGTVEPRKGYGDLLTAFDRLWKAGEAMTLVIAGRPGWKTQALQARLRRHAEWGRRLFWFDNADDRMLGSLYAHCAAVLQPSLGEGLGLPLLEAIQVGKPVFARGLPVYRDIGLADGTVHFFPEAARGDELADYLADFIATLAAESGNLASEISRDAD